MGFDVPAHVICTESFFEVPSHSSPSVCDDTDRLHSASPTHKSRTASSEASLWQVPFLKDPQEPNGVP